MVPVGEVRRVAGRDRLRPPSLDIPRWPHGVCDEGPITFMQAVLIAFLVENSA